MTILLNSDFDKISPTALLTAYARQYTDIPHTKEIAELTNAVATVNQFVNEDEKNSIIIALTAIIEGRYKAIDQVRKQFQENQILELASGLLPRGLIASENPEIIFIESDLPRMIEQKQRLSEQLIGKRSNLHFLPIDATSGLNSALLHNYFKSEEPITILCEGLLMYLTFAEKKQVFNNVREILQTFGGVWITPDLTTKTRLEQNIPVFQTIRERVSNSTGRLLAENDFNDTVHIKQFVSEQGFEMEEFNMLDIIDQLHSLSTLTMERSIVERIFTNMSVFALTLAKR